MFEVSFTFVLSGMCAKSIPFEMRMVGRPKIVSYCEKVTIRSTWRASALRKHLSTESTSLVLRDARAYSGSYGKVGISITIRTPSFFRCANHRISAGFALWSKRTYRNRTPSRRM